MKTAVLTYRDTIEHLLDYMGENVTGDTAERYARRAIQNAVMEMQSKRKWTPSYRRGRINTQAPYSTGTVSFDFAGGTYELQVTLTGGTWPSWAADGNLVIENIVYPVFTRISDTVLLLEQGTAPQSDITDSTYELQLQNYPLPVDFISANEMFNANQGTMMKYLPPGEFLLQQRQKSSTSTPWSYTIQNDPRRYGGMMLSMWPAPVMAEAIDYTYKRQARALQSHGATPTACYYEGKATITSASLTVTGTGTNFTSDMVGAIIRFAATSNGKMPTGQGGASPFYVERVVASYTDGQTISMDQVPGVSLTSVPYAISDPVDLEPGAMSTYFLRECEKQCRVIRRMETTAEEAKEYQFALIGAMEADSRHDEERKTFGDGPHLRRWAEMPSGDDIGG